MKKLLLIFIVLFTLIGSIDSQEFLGKNKALVKKEMQKNKGNGKTNDIKSFGYEAYMYSSYPYNSDILYVVFNNKGILNPEKPDVPLNKNDAFQKVQKRRVQEKR